MMTRVWALLIGYLFGNLLFAMIIGKVVLHMNPTKYGSHNPGTANMGAVFGKKWGILTCVGDIAKSLVALGITYLLFHSHLMLAYCALGLMLGHCFPFWNKFSGGKGVAVAAASTVVYDWQAGIITLLIALALVIIMKNLTIAPQVFILLFSAYIIFAKHQVEAGILFFLIFIIMGIRFWHDTVDYFTGHGKKVDILFSLKKKVKGEVK